MRKVLLAPDEYYHVYGRGVEKRIIFMDTADYARFLFLILHLQGEVSFNQIGRHVKNYVEHGVFDIDDKTVEKIIKTRYVDLVSFTLMPNHFHLILFERAPGGISRYMQRVLDAYTKYFNTKYERSGYLFQGPFGAVHMETNDQLLYVSAYIHRNPRELEGWHGKEHLYPWSSYQDYLGKNRWGKLLARERILKQFPNPKTYRKFVETSGAKTKEFEMLIP